MAEQPSGESPDLLAWDEDDDEDMCPQLTTKEMQEHVTSQKGVIDRLGTSMTSLATLLKPPSTEAQEAPVVSTELNYQDVWPDVEITIALIEVLSFNLVGMSFDAEFVVHLDWLDPQLRRGIHYDFNAESGRFDMMQQLKRCKNDLHFFNPKLVVANSKTELEEDSSTPKILDEIPDENGDDIPWLHKEFHFVGSLLCRHVNAFYFPFDIAPLHIKLSSPDMQGLTSQGRKRRFKFVEPELRKAYRLKKARAGHPVAGFAETLVQCPGKELQGEKVGKPFNTIMTHMWRIDKDGGDTLSVGEMTVLAIGGVATHGGHMYTFTMVLRRIWNPRYLFDIAIYNLQTITALTSLWAPFGLDMLANRMSITLTVLLTVVGVASIRPPVIADLPYTTVHDIYGQAMIFSVLLIGVANLMLFISCEGVYRTTGVDDYFDTRTLLEAHNFRDGSLGQEACMPGFCGASQLDCGVLYLTFFELLAGLVIVFLSSQIHRITAILRIKHIIDCQDQHFTYLSKLVLCDHVGGFKLLPRDGDSSVWTVARSVVLLPGFRWFWSLWKLLFTCRKHICPQRCRRRIMSVAQVALDVDAGFLDDAAFHPLECARLLEEATQQMLRKKQHLPSISHFPVKLTTFDTLRALDVGSGEMGFYSYWLDESSRTLNATGADDKLKYKKGLTFVNQFLEDPGGPDLLTKEVIHRFALRPCTPLHSALSITRGSVGSSPLPPVVDHAELPKNSGAPTSEAGFPKEYLINAADSVGQRSKRYILVCLTGANRQMLMENAEGRQKLNGLIEAVTTNLRSYEIELIPYCPEDSAEAMYELWATEWVVQNGDLSVANLKLSKAYRILQKAREEARTNWKEVRQTFQDLRADRALEEAYSAAAGVSDPQGKLPDQVICHRFYSEFEKSKTLLRALVRARSFSGTLSAGSGSCQVTFRTMGSLDRSQVNSVPMGNRTPMVSLNLTGAETTATVFSKRTARTAIIAQRLLCEPGANTGGGAHTRPAWSEDGPVDPQRLNLWRELVMTCAEELEVPRHARGLFVGISAVFYAAKAAGCVGEILARDDFLAKVDTRISALIETKTGPSVGKDLSNLVLVSALVTHCLHKSALIVCKRNWKVGPEGKQVDFAATWTLGMYLKHSGLMGIPLHA